MADNWFVAAAEHHANSVEPDDFIDPDIADELIYGGALELEQSSEEGGTRCWTYRPI